MNVFYSIPAGDFKFNKPVVTIGNFDGVHRGHQEIFSKMISIAAEANRDTVVITFREHPRKILFPERTQAILSTLDEKLAAIEASGVASAVVLDFTREFAAMHAAEFINKIIVEGFDASAVVMGYDHAFGKNREGNIDYLLTLGPKDHFRVEELAPFVYDGHPVSSSWIRTMLLDGDVSAAQRLLARPYSFSGTVEKGFMRGRTLGFPTANIRPDDAEKIIPADGVYAGRIRFADGRVNNCMVNVGTNPTFGSVPRVVEANIFDFDEDIYGQHVSLEYHKRIRDEVAFSSVDGLVTQIAHDKTDCEKYFEQRADL